MTEAEWLACEDPDAMFSSLTRKASERQNALFAYACCRRIVDLFPSESHRMVVAMTEGYADGEVSTADYWAAVVAAQDAEGNRKPPHELQRNNNVAEAFNDLISSRFAYSGSSVSYHCAASVGFEDQDDARHAELKWHAGILRCMLGNPFRPTTVEPIWFIPTVVSLAEAIYADRAFDRMPILADALEEAGCDNADILTHCRGEGPHVRGCWVVDLILGKQ